MNAHQAAQRGVASLHARAQLYAQIRAFFADRGVLEIETPVLSVAGNTDPQIDSLRCEFNGPLHAGGRTRYLRTSPEYFHKRLLAAGSGPIYELGKVFRDGEFGARHNPEFSMLEWYRPGWDHHRLMDEVAELVNVLLQTAGQGSWPVRRLTFAELFQRYAGVDPFAVDMGQLHALLAGLGVNAESLDRDQCLDYLRAAVIEPELPEATLTFVSEFPASQSALARIRPGDPPVAERFELYLGRVELANGYFELTDAAEQRQRLLCDQARRQSEQRHVPPIDDALLAALEAGMPDCAGVALGVDRLLMALGQHSDIASVLSFPFDQA